MNSLEGGCLCGQVRYRAGGAPHGITICHCTSCRRASGAPMVAWCGFDAGQLIFRRGAPAIYKSSAAVERGFCTRCGTQLTYRRDDEPGSVDVTIASLDNPEAIPPRDHPGLKSNCPGSN